MSFDAFVIVDDLMTRVILLLEILAYPSSLQLMKILLAGIIGGIVMFVWTSIAHMALPLGEAGINEIPNESAVLERDAEQYR